MNLFPDAGYIDDYEIVQKGRKVIAACTTEHVTCLYADAITLREGNTKKDYVLNKKAIEKLQNRMMAHVDSHRTSRFRPQRINGPKIKLPDEPPF